MVAALGVDVGPSIHQQPDHRLVTLQCRRVDERTALGIDVGSYSTVGIVTTTKGNSDTLSGVI